jgi:phosphatidylinositol-3,4,5-trisphosphate 3-phosphatase/dual-specificity protein phosphatase PTEN
MLSLPELPPPPMLDRSYSDRAPKDQHGGPVSASTQPRDGWIVVGSGDTVAEVHAGEEDPGDGASTPAQSERLTVSRSTPASLSTLSRSSSASEPIEVTTTPRYEPIAIGDETAPGSAGQQDRADGKVDAVFKLHSSRRMKPSSTGRGVSIASREYNGFVYAHEKSVAGSATCTCYSRTEHPLPICHQKVVESVWSRSRCS